MLNYFTSSWKKLEFWGWLCPRKMTSSTLELEWLLILNLCTYSLVPFQFKIECFHIFLFRARWRISFSLQPSSAFRVSRGSTLKISEDSYSFQIIQRTFKAHLWSMNTKDHSTKQILSLDSFQIGMLISVALISESGVLNTNNDWFLIFQRLIMSGMAMFLLVRTNLFDFVWL